MKSINLLILSFFFLVPPIVGQVDPVAASILDKFSQRALNAPAVTMKFQLVILDEVDNSTETSEGELSIMGDMYRLDLGDNMIWFNGSVVWTLTPEVEEVTINWPDTTGSAFISSPGEIFTLYRDGYKQRLIEETQKGSIIDLYPEAIDADFVRIRLLINGSYDLVEAEYKRKDGYNLIVRIESYDLKSQYDKSYFSFDRSKYPGVDIIDMRQ